MGHGLLRVHRCIIQKGVLLGVLEGGMLVENGISGWFAKVVYDVLTMFCQDQFISSVVNPFTTPENHQRNNQIDSEGLTQVLSSEMKGSRAPQSCKHSIRKATNISRAQKTQIWRTGEFGVFAAGDLWCDWLGSHSCQGFVVVVVVAFLYFFLFFILWCLRLVKISRCSWEAHSKSRLLGASKAQGEGKDMSDLRHLCQTRHRWMALMGYEMKNTTIHETA